MEDKNRIVVMGSDPLPEMTASEFKEKVGGILSNQQLADAFAFSSNKFWWIEDNEYDFEEGTPEHKKAIEITDEWWALMDEYKELIFDILREEGTEIPSKGQIVALEPFMKKYGYCDGNGWWIKA